MYNNYNNNCSNNLILKCHEMKQLVVKFRQTVNSAEYSVPLQYP